MPHRQGQFDTATSVTEAPTEAGELYWAYVGFHVILLVIAAVWRLSRGAPKVTNSEA